MKRCTRAEKIAAFIESQYKVWPIYMF
jgi:hypothetical protein